MSQLPQKVKLNLNSVYLCINRATVQAMPCEIQFSEQWLCFLPGRKTTGTVGTEGLQPQQAKEGNSKPVKPHFTEEEQFHSSAKAVPTCVTDPTTESTPPGS